MDGIYMITADSAVEDLVEFVRCADIDVLAQLHSQHCRSRDGEPVIVECEGDYSAPYQGGRRMRITFAPDLAAN